jgi:hypothetical protein
MGRANDKLLNSGAPTQFQPALGEHFFYREKLARTYGNTEDKAVPASRRGSEGWYFPVNGASSGLTRPSLTVRNAERTSISVEHVTSVFNYDK